MTGVKTMADLTYDELVFVQFCRSLSESETGSMFDLLEYITANPGSGSLIPQAIASGYAQPSGVLAYIQSNARKILN